MTADEVARSLGGRRRGREWIAKCPAHHDHTPSLSVTVRQGKLLAHCHAGCPQRNVIAALQARGLWSQPKPLRPESERRRIVAAYNYTDECGDLLYQVVRYEPKSFAQRRPDDRGGWTWKKSERQVLFHLPEVLEAAIVFVVEGERDAETLREHGFVATTNAGGAKAPWLDSYTESLRGREIILIPDADRAGQERVLRIVRALKGKVARLVILTLDDGSKDITKWFERGHSECELM